MIRASHQLVATTPLSVIRRFDVFAEYTRQERLGKGDAEDEAKGYGIWLAKVVASRQSFASSGPSDRVKLAARSGGSVDVPKFRSVGDELQTDATFDYEIIDRMGREFYEEIFIPAIREARMRGASYESIRDEIRKPWKPDSTKSRLIERLPARPGGGFF